MLRQSYWRYIEDIVTPKSDEGEHKTMKKFWSYVKSKKTDYVGVGPL